MRCIVVESEREPICISLRCDESRWMCKGTASLRLFYKRVTDGISLEPNNIAVSKNKNALQAEWINHVQIFSPQIKSASLNIQAAVLQESITTSGI